jgi:hypothetical protein
MVIIDPFEAQQPQRRGIVDPFEAQPAPQIVDPFDPKPEEEGFFTGLGKSIYGGARDTGGSLYSAGATAVGANQAVVESAQAAAARSPEQAKALQAYQADIQKRKQAGDEGLLAGIKNVAGATVDNPEGALQMVCPSYPILLWRWVQVRQVQVLVRLRFVVPCRHTVVGFLVGLFGANTALELGNKAQEKARDGEFTDAERYEAMKEGVVKGGVITAVDAATFGASKWIMGTANRAVETATVRTIEDAGLDAAKATTAVKKAQADALAASAGQGKEAATAAVEKATAEAMAKEGLTDPALVASIRQAQAKALEGVNTVARKAGRGGAALGLESTGEGLGEYLGEYAATGEASPTDAVLEALAGLSLSLAELNGATRLDKPGALTGGTNAYYSQLSRSLDDQLKVDEAKVTEQLTAQLGRPPTEEELNAKLNQLSETPSRSAKIAQTQGPISKVSAYTDINLAKTLELQLAKPKNKQNQPLIEAIQTEIQKRATTQGEQNVGQTIPDASGAGVQVAGQPDTDITPAGVRVAEPDGMVPARQDVAGVATGEATQPVAIVDPFEQTSVQTKTPSAQPTANEEARQAPIVDERGAVIPATEKGGNPIASAGFKTLDEDNNLSSDLVGATFITGMDVSERNKGAGTQLLNSITNWADENNRTLVLVPAAQPDPSMGGLSQEQLKEWYARNGFEDRVDYMVRTPPQEQQAPPSGELDTEAVISKLDLEGTPRTYHSAVEALGQGDEIYAFNADDLFRLNSDTVEDLRRLSTPEEIKAAAKDGFHIFSIDSEVGNKARSNNLINQINDLVARQAPLRNKNGAAPKPTTAKGKTFSELQEQIDTLKKELAQNGPTDEAPSVLPAREEPLPYLAGMHPETATAVQENDITGALKALARNTSGFFSDLAKRLAELKLQTGISFDNERNLVRRAIDLKTAAQQKRLFTYISLYYPNQYNKYFKNYDREENLEKVFEGLRAVSKLNLGPVISEYNDVVYQYEKNIPGLTAPGAYFPQFNEITLNTKTRTGTGNRVMLHEVVHAATVAMLAEDTTKLTSEQKEAVYALVGMYQYAKKVLPPGDYGMTNIYEFVSEVFTNKKFQDRLRAIPYKVKGQKGGLLTVFIQKILDLFGMNNLASSAMVQAEKLFSAEVPSTTASSGPKFAKGKRIPKPKGPISTQDKWHTAEGVNSKGIPNARTYMDVINDILHRRMPWDEGRKELSSTLWSAEGGNVRRFTLGFLNLRQIADLTATKFPQLTGAIKTIEQMLAYRGTKLKRAEGTTVKWIAAQRRDPRMSSLMSRVMLEATMRGIDPDTASAGTLNKPFQDAWDALDNDFKEIYREVRDFYADSIKDMVNTLKERAKAHGTPTEIAERLKQINDQFGPDKLLKPYFPLRRFGEHYFQVGEGDYKEFYTFEYRSTRDLTMKKRRKELMAGNPQQQKAAELITPGTGTSNILASMSTTKVVKDAQKLIDGLGNSIEDNLKKNPGAIPTQDAEKYIAELKGEMKDALNQLLYITLPQVSMRKMFINRRSIQGASEDMLRVFATTAVHSAYQQSRLKYSEDFFSNLVNAKSHVTRSFSPERQAIYDDYIKEVAARAKTILSTEDTSTTAKVAGTLSESTFYFMLSAPFTAMLNIIGATTIAMPYIGARYGYAKANALMLKNLGKYTATAPTRTFAPMATGKFLEVQFPSIVEGGKLSKLLQRAADLFVADGDITISLINDINNLSERPSGLYTGNYQNVKKVLSGLFHQSERLNREVVLMTTFELAYEKFSNADKTDLQGVIERDKTTGQPIKYTEEEAFEEAIAEAREIAGQTLGDFSRQMKPRYFTPPVLGLLFKFKQYAVLATYVVMRNLYLSIGAPFSKSELKEFRAQLEIELKNEPDNKAIIEQQMKEIETQRQELYKEARRRLAGILGITFLYGGMEAMPFFSLLGLIVGMFAGGGDDEDPSLFEWNSWFRNYMQETFGGAGGAILARGLGTAVSSGALTERVSLDIKDLWYRDGRFSPDAREGVINTVIANSGPVVGLGFNLVDAYSLANEGQLDRAFEKALPAIASKPLVATRIATEEGRTRRGVALAEDFSAWEIAIQAIGLQPERFAIAQKNAIDAKLHEQKVDNEKNALLNRLWMERDTDEYDDILDKVDDFNARHPVLAITGRTIQDSFKNRAKNQAIAENLGVQLSNPKMIEEVESKLQYKPYSVFGKNE